MSRDCCVALPHDAICSIFASLLALSAVCDCGIALSYTLTIVLLGPCFVMQYFVSFLVLHTLYFGRESERKSVALLYMTS